MDNLFIQVPNVFSIDGNMKLNHDELYLYYYISLNETRWYKCKTITHIDIIADQLKFRKNINQNKNRVKEVLQSLAAKNIITVEIKGSIIIITKREDDSYTSFKEKFKNGFEQIHHSIFEMVNDYRESQRAIYFMILCYIKKCKREISFDEWARVLECNEKTARNNITEMESNHMINVLHGRYYLNEKNLPRQEMNAYSVNESTNPVEDMVDEKDNPFSSDSTPCSHNWNDSKADLTVDDFVVYLTTTDSKLKKKAQGRINAISKNEKGEWMMDNLMEEAKEKVIRMKSKVEKVKREKILESATNALIDADGNIIVVDSDNIDSIDFTKIEKLFYGEDENSPLLGSGELKKLVSMNHPEKVTDEHINYAVDMYKKIVKSGEKLTQEKGSNIRDIVQNKFKLDVKVVGSKATMPSREELDQMTIDGLNASMGFEDEPDESERAKIREKKSEKMPPVDVVF